jgi:GNAT superfamily N-acetyltransferase
MNVREVGTKRDLKRFITFPWKIYRNDPNWVPPLLLERREFLDAKKNPFFEHATVKLFLAYDDAGSECGRIAAVINFNHIRTHDEHVGFFGLFECVDDPAVAKGLFDAAGTCLRSQGMQQMRGPENLSVNDDIGLLVDGFDTPPAVMMPHNPPYYERLIEGYGFKKTMDLFAYWGQFRSGRVIEEVERGAEICRRRYNCTIRPLRMDHFAADLKQIHAVYTTAWEDNWGAVAMTDKEFEHLARMLKDVIDPELCLIAEVQGEVAGFCLALPDLNQVLIKLNGRLFPSGIFKFLYYRRKIDAFRLITMGVIKKFRNKGIDALFYHEIYRRSLKRGIWRGEMSWILENNAIMNRIVQRLGLRVYKTYRLYDFCL